MDTKAKILYVDDDKANLTSFKFLFQEFYEIHLTESAEQGIEAMREQEFDLILADQRMSGMSGTEFLTCIRDESPQIFRMIVTGYSDIDKVIDAINNGYVYH
ncbi:MAG: response regulator [Bacteroidetes bacterium]|nr:response regulator [Bacteroidota bacterium]